MKHETLDDQTKKNAVNSRRLRKESAKHQQAIGSKKRTLLEVEQHGDIENHESDDDDEEELDDEDDYKVSPLTTVIPPNSSNLLIEAKLVFDPVHADPVDTEEQEEVIVQTRRYFKLLISVSVFDGLAITASLIGVAISFTQNPNCKWLAIVFAYIPADCFLFISTILYSFSMCVAARDPTKQLMLRTGFGALVGATLGLLVAIVLLWKVRTKLGFVLMVIAFALTIVSFYCTLLLRRNDQTAKQEGRRRRCHRFLMVVAILVVLFLLTYGTWTYESDLPIDKYPDCIVPNEFYVGDGSCDGFHDPAYATEACGFDDGDCRLTGENCSSGFMECASGFCDPNTRTCL